MGGLTAASTETCTATGATTLGSRTNSVSSITMANNVVTVATTAPHGLAVGAMFNMAGVTIAVASGLRILLMAGSLLPHQATIRILPI